MKTLLAAITVVLLILPSAGGLRAQVAQWNHFVQDEQLEQAFHAALNQVAAEHQQEMEKQNRPAVILFLDAQKDVPLLMSSSTFRHNLIAASRAKADFIINYQALTSKDVKVTIGIMTSALTGIGPVGAGRIGAYGGSGPQIPGDGGMMLCPINKSGLKFMYGALAVTSLDDAGNFRVSEDGTDVQKLRDRIMSLTYEKYGHTPEE